MKNQQLDHDSQTCKNKIQAELVNLQLSTLNNENVDNESFTVLKHILDNLDAIVYVSDLSTGKIIYLNQFAKNIYGDVKQKICWQVFQKGEYEPCKFCTNDRLLDENLKPTGVYVWESLSSYNNRWYDVHDQAIIWENGKYVRLEIAYDITDKKKDEKRIFKLLNQQSVISKIASLFNAPKDFNEKVNTVLQLIGKQTEASRVFLYENLPGNRKSFLAFEWCNESIISFSSQFKEVTFKNLLFLWKQIQLRGRLKANNVEKEFPEHLLQKLRPFETKAMLIVPIYVSGNLFGFIGIDDTLHTRSWHMMEIGLLKTISDIMSNAYERKQVEEAVRRSEQKLREANAAKDKFFSIIAHDLKNPIFNLISLSEFLIDNFDKWEESKTKEFIKYIHQSSKQGFNLLENLLEWSRSQTGRIVHRPKKVDIKELVCETVNLLKTTADNKGIHLLMLISEHTFVYADINMVMTVIRNLISNALKFTNSGGTVKIYTTDITNETGKKIKITVEDSGVGISKDDIIKLFRIDMNHTTVGTAEERGTGLGLLLCKEFVERNNGEIWVESALGKGSKFIFTLPVT